MRLGAVSMRHQAGLARAARFIASAGSPSAIAIATKSTTTIARRSEDGLVSATGTSPDDQLVEIMELPGHPWFLGCQFHPELKSRPLDRIRCSAD